MSEMKKTGLFDDPDLKTPMHDEIMVWLDSWLRDWNNVQKVCDYKKHKEVFVENVQQIKEEYPTDYSENKYDGTTYRKIKWERPITGYNGYVHGFADLEMIIRRSRLSISNHTVMSPYDYSFRDERRIDYIKAFEEGSICIIFLFEVKSKIISLGDLIRQVQLYRSKVEEAKFYVVSPDVMKYKNVLKSQGIGCIEYPTGEVY